MSDDSMEDFLVNSDSGSDFEASPPPAKKSKKSPVAKAPAKPKAAAKATTKTVAPKKKDAAAPAKPKAKAATTATTAKTTATKKRKVVDSEDDDGESSDDEVIRRDASSSTVENHNVVDLDNDASEADSDAAPAKKKAPAKPKTGPSKSASDTYQKLTQVEHVLKRPDSYIGSTEPQTQPMWVFDSATNGMVYRNITFTPGLYKIFDEILVNAADNKRNDPSMDTMKIGIDRETGTISCMNTGRGIPVEIHSKEKLWIPELIFGHLLSSSNYDDDQKKITGGRNGYGAKLANIYSHEFVVETADTKNGKKYKQVWKSNMSNAGKPKITENTKGEEWTKITFKPDFDRFGMPDGIDDDTESLLMKRVYDMAGTLAGVKVYLNNKKIPVTNFKKYAEMYTNAVNELGGKKGKGKKVEKKDDAPAPSQMSSREGSEAPLVGANADGSMPVEKTIPIVYEKFGERWEVAFAPSDGQFQQVSFVNSIATTKGGTHIEFIAKQLVDGIIESISKKAKKQVSTIKGFAVKNQLWVFVNCLIENPSFDSQTKENMTLPSKKFGSKCTISEGFLKKVLNSGVVDNILHWAQFKQDQLMKKTDGTKRSRMLGIAKLDDANKAGTKDARNCTLILTEGDSAKTFAISGLSVVGRDTYGVFPLRGKLLNVRDAGGKQLTENVEIAHLKKILGLQNGKAYTSVDSLRYGKLMVMTDQDHDGSHIKGLIINFLDHFFPGLLQIPGFLVEFITPIVKVSKGKKHLSFFTIPEYEAWKEENADGRGWHIKYYKGLGTSTSKDAKEYFSDLKRHMIKFAASTNEDRALVDMAFNKKKADDRKEWLRGFVPGTYLDHNTREIPIREFINKELVLFSMADNVRSIPSVIDGFKPGQRKVLFGCFKRNLKSEAKVAQLVGYISETTAYHHGEASLAGTIVGMAQHFVGNNNINPLMPNGQFGSRLQGGKDHASPRYIFTSLSSITRKIFRKEDDDILTYLNDDGQSIEPMWYIPILPMVLVNGSDGIGTGWSSAIPNYNPSDIVANLRRKLEGVPMEPMHPWFRGFKGPIQDLGGGRYATSGIAMMTSEDTVEIFELPIRTWTNTYVEQLLAWSQATDKQPAIIKEFTSQSSELSVHLIITLTAEGRSQVKKEGLDKVLKLTSSVSTSNMVGFDVNGKIKKYSTPEEIISDFYDVRLSYYMKRKDHLVDTLTIQYERFANQARFIQMFIKGELKIANRALEDIVRDLRKLKFRPFPKVVKAHVAADPDASTVVSPEDLLEEIDDEDAAGDLHDYDYLLEMSISTLTATKAKKLLAQRDEKEAELKVLLGQTPRSMWLSDLDEFSQQWEALLAEDELALTNQHGVGKSKGGKGKIGAMKGNTLESAFAKAAALKAAAQASASPEAKPTKAKSAAASSKLGGATSKPKAIKASSTAKALSAPKPKKKKLAYDSDFDESSEEDDKVDITLYDDSDIEESDRGEGGSDNYARPASKKIIDLASDSDAMMDEDEDESFIMPPPKKR